MLFLLELLFKYISEESVSTQKIIWIINQYASTPETGIGGRHFYLAQELAKQGHKIYIIAGSYSHLLHTSKELDTDFLIEKVEDNFHFVWVKLPKYADAHSKKRIINEFLFSKQLTKLTQQINDTPDVILHSSPALISYFGVRYLTNYYKAPYVFEVRDIWPLTLMKLGGYSKNHPFIKLLQWIEDQAYQKADYVFSNLPNAVEHMQSRGMNKDKFTWIANGISLAELDNKKALSTEVRDQIPIDKFVVGYTGTLGEANAMNYLIDAANILKDKSNIHFVLVGAGKIKADLVKKIEYLGLNNLTFIDPIEKTQVQSMLALFDACYIGWQNKSMYRFGIAANKIPEYLYSVKPIIHSFSGKGDFIQQSGAGITVAAEDPKAIANAVLELQSKTAIEREAMGVKGKAFVIDHLTYKKLANKLADTLFKAS